MKHRNFVFHVAAAIAFLSATPMLGGPTVIPIMPNLHFVEDTSQPNRAVSRDFLTCGDNASGDTAVQNACEIAIKDALKNERSTDK